MALLKEIFRQTGGGEDAVARQLQHLRRQRPDDRTILYALVDALGSQGKAAEATKLLAEAAQEARYETELVRRLFKLYESAGDDARSADAALMKPRRPMQTDSGVISEDGMSGTRRISIGILLERTSYVVGRMESPHSSAPLQARHPATPD